MSMRIPCAAALGVLLAGGAIAQQPDLDKVDFDKRYEGAAVKADVFVQRVYLDLKRLSLSNR